MPDRYTSNNALEASKKGKSHKKKKKEFQFPLYARRWFVLGAFSLLSMTSAWIWITWSPIAIGVAKMWGVTEGSVDDLSGVYMYVYVFGSFVSLWLVVNELGLRWGLVIAAVLNATGGLIRYFGRHGYRYVYVGTMFCASAETFILSMPPLIAGCWFGAKERATATAVGVLANQFGTAMGLGATIVLDLSDRDHVIDTEKLRVYLLAQCISAIFAMILICFFVTSDDPPTPPNAAAAIQTITANAQESDEEPDEETNLLRNTETSSDEEEGDDDSDQLDPLPSYLESIQMAFNTSLGFVFFFGLSVGVYYTIPTFLSQLVPTWSPRSVGWLGVFYQLSGVVGSFATGRAVDISQRHRFVCLILATGSIAALLVFELVLDENSAMIFVAASIVGFCLASLNTIGLELGTAMTYPADEAAVAGILECAAALGGFLLVTIGGSLDKVGSYFVGILCMTLISSQVILCSIEAKSKRPKLADFYLLLEEMDIKMEEVITPGPQYDERKKFMM